LYRNLSVSNDKTSRDVAHHLKNTSIARAFQLFDRISARNAKMGSNVKKLCVRIGLVTAGVALATLGVLSKQDGYLDLTDPVPRQRIHSPTGGGTGGFCGGGGGDPTAIPETTVTLESLDEREYSVGEEVTFEVKVENTGGKNIEIPWSPHLGDLEPSDPTRSYTYRVGLLILTLTDPDSHRFLKSW
jgi:hypothetical protein